MKGTLPETQYAVQLVGPREIRLNAAKVLARPRPRQLVCRVEAAGLCYSDLKLMNQFSAHPRKLPIISGIDASVLAEIPSYVPGELPTVPGHEAVVRVCAVGEDVRCFRPGERYLVETDYRWLRTAGSNGSFGYNFEGALQEYVLMDERVITSPEGEATLLRVSDDLSASAVALVEPWACVEDAYAEKQRRGLLPGGRALFVADNTGAANSSAHVRGLPPARQSDSSIPLLPDASFDDIVYAGSSVDAIEALLQKVAPHGLLNIALCGRRLEREVMCPVGRVHYGGIRITGTTGSDPSDSLATIPPSAEVPANATVHIIGAGGPMGTMHVVRVLSAGIPGVSVVASDMDDVRLAVLAGIAEPLAEKNGVAFCTSKPAGDLNASYIALMVPSAALAAQAVKDAAPRGIINIFAGIPAETAVAVDLNAYIAKRLYFVGTSGSVVDDMRTVLAKVSDGPLDTNLSVAAIAGLDGAADGIAAIANRMIPGKVIVYPWCHGLGLTSVTGLAERLPAVSTALEGGRWSLVAERRLAEAFGYKWGAA